MKCPNCGFESPPGFAFCGRCGTRLEADTARLTPADADHLRRYLPLPLLEALQLDLPTPSPQLLNQCLSHLTRLAEATSAYVPEDLAEQLARDPVPGQPMGRFVHGTLLFADISGFTAMSEKLSRIGREGAEEITAIVNRYLGVMMNRLYAHRGQLMKFGGDAMLGLFPEPDSAARATQAALEMQAAMAEFAQTRTSQGSFPLRMKVGLHRGRFFAAQLGDANSMEYALFGRDVNATAAAESAAQAGQVVLDRDTLDAIGPRCRAHPLEAAPGYVVVESIQGERPDGSPHTSTGALLFEPNLNGLRRAVQVLDTLTPYLPDGLLARLVLSTQTLGFEGEHRLVAVLFANVHGLGALADSLGPGQEPAITAALNRYFLQVSQAVNAFGGVINKIDLYDHGDKLVVLFGAPVAHEDDAERALRAALRMADLMKDEGERPLREDEIIASSSLRLHPSSFRQQIGVNFGNVFAGYVGTRQRREYSVIGDEVNLAARLMSVAQAGQIVVGPGMRRRLHAFFHFTPRGSVPLKGKSEPVPIFTVEGARTAAEAEQERQALRAPLVGRQVEWNHLTAALEALHSGRGVILSVIGEAGLGKTRLIDELRQFVRSTPSRPIRWAEGRCLSYTESVSYAPFQELIRQLIGAPVGASEAETWERLGLALAAAEAEVHRPYLANFLNLHLDAEQQARVRHLDGEALQRRTFVAIAALIEGLTRQAGQRLMLVLEDIHWIDQASRALLEYLLVLVSRTALGVLLLYRPERTKACWQVRETIAREYAGYSTEIELNALPAAETQSLLNQLVPVAQWPAELQHLILHQTEGNPLYLEELLRVLIETGVLVPTVDGRQWQVTGSLESLQVPDTLEGVMMTRLDRLDEPSRNTAQVASVIGRSFSSDVLAHLTDDKGEADLLEHLFRLQQHEIARETQHAPERIYTFRHGLMQEVCYGSLLARIRRKVHRQIAEYLQARSGADEGIYPVIARHAFLGQDWPRALRYQRLAGHQAQRLFANSEAIDHFTKALQSAEALAPEETRVDRLNIHLALGELLTVTARYDRADEHLAQAQTLGAQVGDREAEARACRWRARLSELRGDYAAAFQWIDEGLEVLAGQETAEAAPLQLIAGLIHARRGEREPAWERATAAARIAERWGELAVLASASTLQGLIRWQSGDIGTAVTLYQRALDLYEQAGDLAGQAKAQNALANALFKSGRWKEADEHYGRARATFDQIGAAYNRALAENNLGGIAVNQGRLEEAAAFYQQALHTLEQIGASPYVRGTVHMNLGATHIRRQALSPALQHLKQAQALFEQTQSRDFLPELHRHLARAAFRANDVFNATMNAHEALRCARELGMRGEEGSALRVLGEIALQQGRTDEAEAHLRASTAILCEVADDYELAHSRFTLGRALSRSGKRDEAIQVLDQALEVFARLDAEMDLRAAQILRAEL